MKYYKSLLLSFIFISCLSSCNQNKEMTIEEESHPMTYENEKSLGEKTTIINGFESNKDLDSLMPLNYLGKINLNSEIKKNGDYSAKVTLFNQNISDNSIGNPTICQSLFNVSRDVYESDVTNVKYIKLNVYNPQDVDYRIGMRPIIISTYDWIGGPVLPTKWITVRAHEWTEMSYEVNLAIIPEVSLSVRGEAQSELIHYLPAMYFVFLRPKGEESDRSFYLDDFCVEKF